MRAIGGDPFNMTVAGLRLARKANAVSGLHGETARTMWKHISDGAPIISVTNGVNGWAIGDGDSGDDEKDLAALDQVLNGEVLPAWADRERWLAMMQASIAMGAQKFSAERMLRDYFARLYAVADAQAVEAPGGEAASR